MKKIFILSLAALALFTACKKDSLTDTTNSFTATIEQSGAKTTLGTGNKVNWEADDAISVNGVTLTTTGPTGDNLTQATFTSESTVALNASTPYYKAFYPASYYHDDAMHLPDTQEYDAVTNGISNLPMYAQSDNHDLVFKNLCGVLAITVPQSEMTTVSSITVYSDQQLNGAINVTYSDDVPTVAFSPAQTADTYKKVTLNLSSAVDIPSEGKTFYIAIPEQTYTKLDIVVAGEQTTTNGTVAAKLMKSTGSSMPVQRNHIYSINFSSTYAIRGTATVSSTAGRTGNKCGWVQLWEDGPKFAEFNVGATIDSYGSLTSGAESTTWGTPNATLQAIYNTANVGGLYPWKTPNKNGRTTTWGSSLTLGSSDVAKSKWGDLWKTPTKNQLIALIDGITGATLATGTTLGLVWEWMDGSTSQYVPGCTLAGFKVSGKAGTAYASNSIFLPAAGYYSYNYTYVGSAGSSGDYWSLTAGSKSNHAYGMNILTSTDLMEVNEFLAKNGRSVRAILAE